MSNHQLVLKLFLYFLFPIGLDHEYLRMEQLTNLKALPTSGFKVALFPLKIKGASAAPAPVVAIMEED